MCTEDGQLHFLHLAKKNESTEDQRETTSSEKEKQVMGKLWEVRDLRLDEMKNML
jgi:hypothetical protein